MADSKKLTAEQKSKLAEMEPRLREAVRLGNYLCAKKITLEIQNVLRPTGHETRLMKSKNWLFEAAMEAGELRTAVSGFTGIRQKVSKNTRIYLEATALLAICHLRLKNLGDAEPLMAEVLGNDKYIKSVSKRRDFRRRVAERFKQEGALAALRDFGNEKLIPSVIQSNAGKLVQSKNEEEILDILGVSIPLETIRFLQTVDDLSRKALPYTEVKFLPSPETQLEKKELGRTMFASLKRVLWRSLCDPKSDIYNAWFNEGVTIVLNKKYIASAIVAALSGLGIGVKAIAVSVTALVVKFGLEVFCDRYMPDGIMGA
jgi:hypothetical protein